MRTLPAKRYPTSDPRTRFWPAGLWLITVIVLITAAPACVDSQTPDQGEVRGAPSPIAPPGNDELASTVIFPRHDAPLGTDRGGEYFAGPLILEEGCLRVEVSSNHDPNDPGSWLLVWPNGFTYETESGMVRVEDDLGRVVAHVGDYIRLSRATLTFQQAAERKLVRGLSDQCTDPYFLVGDEVTTFDPRNEAAELHLSDPDVVFFREETSIARHQALLTAAGVGELILDGHCLRLKDNSPRPNWPTIIWPAGFTPHVHEGVVQIRNGAGRVIAEVGNEIAGGGGFLTGAAGNVLDRFGGPTK